MEKKTVIQPQDKYVLRLPDGMRDRIKAAADRNNRSMNAEIVATLEVAYPQPFSVRELVQNTKAIVEDLRTHNSLQSLIELQEVLTEAAAVLADIPPRHKPDNREDTFKRARELVNRLSQRPSEEDPNP